LGLWKGNFSFDAVVFSREYGGEKPCSSAFNAVSDQTGIPLVESIMVGDNLYRDIVGSLKIGVGAAFWVRRQGSFFNFDEKLFEKALPNQHFYRINNLTELLWYLPGPDKKIKSASS
jgi:FMN phosphatase YigB (HAD superfamily)